MNDTIIIVAVAVLASVAGFFLSWFMAKRITRDQVSDATAEAKRIVAEAKKESEIKLKG